MSAHTHARRFQPHEALAPSSSNSLPASEFPALPFLPAFFPQHKDVPNTAAEGVAAYGVQMDNFDVTADQAQHAFASPVVEDLPSLSLILPAVNSDIHMKSAQSGVNYPAITANARAHSHAHPSPISSPSPQMVFNSDDSDSPSSISATSSYPASSSSASPLPSPSPTASSSSMQAIPVTVTAKVRRPKKTVEEQSFDNPPPLRERKRRHRWTDHERRKRERREIQELRDALKQIHSVEAQIIAETHIFPPPSADNDDDDDDDEDDFDDDDEDAEDSADSGSSNQRRGKKGKRAKGSTGKAVKRERKHHGKIVILERTANAIHVLQRRLAELTQQTATASSDAETDAMQEEKSPSKSLKDELQQLTSEIMMADRFLIAQRESYASSVLASAHLLRFPFNSALVSIRGGLLDFNSMMAKESGWGNFMPAAKGRVYNETGLLLGVANYTAAHICGEQYEGSDPMDQPKEVIAQKGAFWRMSKKRFETFLAVLEAFSRMDLSSFLPILLFSINHLRFPEVPLLVPPAGNPADPYAEPPYYCMSDLLPYFYATHPATFRYSLPGLAKFASLFRGDVPSIEVACSGVGPAGDIFWSTTLTVFALFDDCVDELSGLPCRRPIGCGLVRFTSDGRFLGNLKKIIPKRFFWSKWSLVDSVQHGFELDVRTFDLAKALDEKNKVILPPEKGIKVDLADRDYSCLNADGKSSKCNSTAAAARDPLTPAHLSPIPNPLSPSQDPKGAKVSSPQLAATQLPPMMQSIPSLSASSSLLSSQQTANAFPTPSSSVAGLAFPAHASTAAATSAFSAATPAAAESTPSRAYADLLSRTSSASSPMVSQPANFPVINSWVTPSSVTAAANAHNSLTDSAVNAAYSVEYGRLFDVGSMQAINSQQLQELTANKPLPYVYR